MTEDFTIIMNNTGQLECGRGWNDGTGGYTNDPRDPGGETKYGISKRAYPNVDIKNLTKAGAIALYFRDYWLPSGGDGLSFPLAAMNFDCAVNQGIGRAKKFLAGCEGDWKKYAELRRQHYLSLHNSTYEKGWLNRVNLMVTFVLAHLQS